MTERSDLSHYVPAAPQASRTARVLCHNHWRGPRSVGARDKLRKVVCMGQSPPFRRVNLFVVGHWHPPPPELVASTFRLPLRIIRQPFSFKPQLDHVRSTPESGHVRVTE